MAEGLQRGEADIREVVEAALRTVLPPPAVRVSLQAELADPVVRLRREEIERTLVDLLRNACEAMPAGGTLTVTLGEAAAGIEIGIRDQGAGIPPERLDELFTPFFTTKPAGEGTGLSLVAAYVTIKAHGGRIVVASNADPAQGPTGTTVRITLPRRPPLADPARTRLILHDDA